MSSGDFWTGYMVSEASNDPDFFVDMILGLELFVAGYLFANLEFIPVGEGIIYGIGLVVVLSIAAGISKTLGIIIAILLTIMVGFITYHFTKGLSSEASVIAIVISVLISFGVNSSKFLESTTPEDEN